MQSDSKLAQLQLLQQLDELDAVSGNGTTLVSLYIPGTSSQLAKMQGTVKTEIALAQNIKSKQTRTLVSDALKVIEQRLHKLVRTLPENGVGVFAGVDQRDGRSVVAVVPALRPLPSSLYTCNKKFNTQPLRDQLEDQERFGVIVISGKGALFGVVAGSSQVVVDSFTADLPNKHGRGGQSSARFGRLYL